jgi:hypothetical protein
MNFSEETLMAYADDELDSQTRSALEAAMALDPELAHRVAKHKALREQLRASFDKVLHEPPPQRLIDAARGVPAVRREGNVIPLRRKPPPRRAWPQWTSLAACLFVGVLLGQVLLRTAGNTGPITSRDGRLLANGVLAESLSEQLSNAQKEDAPVRIGLSFKSKDGEYCRTFTLRNSTTLAGLACREHDDWRLRVLAQANPTSTNGNQYRQAESEVPPSVMQTVESTISGDPLDARAENAAREMSWTAQ